MVVLTMVMTSGDSGGGRGMHSKLPTHTLTPSENLTYASKRIVCNS
jgi:hypothetical protein